MQAEYFSYALLAALAMALVRAAVTDIKRREIGNKLNLAIALAAPVYWLVSGLDWFAMLLQVVLAATVFGVTCGLFVLRQMGGGDVKLLTALALWIVPGRFVELVFLMAILGSAASIALGLFNMNREPRAIVRDVLAIAAAVIWIGVSAALTFSVATDTPIIGPDVLPRLAATASQAWFLAAFGLAALAIVWVGVMQIVRRQKSRLPVPYGVAISLAGLWILAEQTIFAAQTI